MTNESEASAEHFTANILPLYQGPSVKIQLQPSNKEYIISRSLLCAESPVFSKMFSGKYRESHEQTVTLEETKDDVSVRSLEALFQWLYRGTVKFGIEDPGERISAAMELTRLADKYDITGLESTMAQYIRDTIKNSPHPSNSSYSSCRHVDSNTYYITTDHIASAALLPRGHPVRRVLAAASVEGLLRSKDHKFREEIYFYPSFGADLLQEAMPVLYRAADLRYATFKDPISETTSDIIYNVSD